jgi:hypothetical protein
MESPTYTPLGPKIDALGPKIAALGPEALGPKSLGPKSLGPKSLGLKIAALGPDGPEAPELGLKIAALGPEATSIEPTFKKNTAKTLEKLKDKSPEEILMATLQLNPLNMAGSISSEFDLFRPCRDVPVWDKLTSDDLYAAITSANYKDPRDLKGACIFIDTATAQTEPSQIMSYCIGEKCAVKVCFDLSELKKHVTNPKNLNKNGLYTNIWADEIKRNSKIPQEIRDAVEHEMSDDWVQAIHCQIFAVEEQTRLKSVTKDSLFNLAAEGLATYFVEHPWAITVGSFFSKIKGAATITGWIKSVSSSMYNLNSYIKNNAFTTNFCIIISKIVRACICLYLSGAAHDTVALLFDHLSQMAGENLIVRFLLNIGKLVVLCLLKMVVLPTATTIWGCIQHVFKTLTGSTAGQFGVYLLNASFAILRFAMSKLSGTQIESFFSVCGNLNMSAYVALKSDDLHNFLLPVLKKAFSRDLNFTLFLLMLSVFPVRSFAGGLVLLLRFGSKNKHIQSTVLLFKSVMEKYAGKIDNVAQLIMFCLHASPEPINIYRTLMEMYYWVFDIGSCLLLKYVSPLKNKFYSYLSITAPPHKESTNMACCFKDFVNEFTDVLNLHKGPKTGGAHSNAADLRLKHLILNTPIFSILFMNKPVNFYLYRWNLEEGAKYGLALNTNAHIGLVAQEFETHFPDHVTTLENGFRDVVDLPCELQHVLAGLNGKQVPKCQTRFKRLKSAPVGR